LTSPRPRTIWCVSDGRTGIERQCVAVANAVSEFVPVETKIIRLTPRAPQVWLPPTMWPAPMAALPQDQRAQLVPPWPDIWIANGRRAIPYSLRMKAVTGRGPLVVQLQNPRVDPARFDLVVPPKHDRLSGPNVVETLGAPVWFTKAQIEAAKAQFPLVNADTSRKVLVVLGGTSKRHSFSHARALEIIAALKAIAATGAHLLITTSRRTPSEVEAVFREFAAATPSTRFFSNEAMDGPNPYLAWLASADCALVTEDSTNMMTDAAFFGLPIHLLQLEGGDARFDRLHHAFVVAGAARWFSGQLETWTYPPVRDALVVARAIVDRLTNATT
jgi:uncharacterized protein